MIKFLHAADLHLDSAFASLSPDKAAQRRKEQREMLQDLAETANANGCDLLLLAGDVFDSDNVYADTIEALQRAFANCQAKIFIAPGNHDALLEGSAYRTAKWPENVHIFQSNTIEEVILEDLGCRIYGAGFLSVYEKPMLEGFAAKQDGLVNLMVLHGDAQNADSGYNAVSKTQIAQSGLDYLAMGHIHMASGLQKEAKTYYAWPGCMMGRGFDELGEKGVYLGQVDKQSCVLQFLTLGKRKYEIMRIPAGDDALCSIQRALPQDTKEDIYRIILTGQSDPIRMPALYEALSPRFFSLQLRDETAPKRDLWQQAQDDTLKGLFLRALKDGFDASQEEEKKRTFAMAARLGLAAMEDREEALE